MQGLCHQVVLIGARGMVGREGRSLWQLLKTWWHTKNVSPYSLIMNNHAIADESSIAGCGREARWLWGGRGAGGGFSQASTRRLKGCFNLNELRSKDLAEFTRGWKKILDLIVSKKLHPRIDSVWSFEDIIEASKQISERRNIGKVVIKP
ncbi:Synaptic vesicle membrane protein VAT-1 -like [Chionoecetes opilio]|uniref:Synaptic vesicle membrane protein VAT-1 -like n=1 Tax=Chionoecetes opilio TaxID=41210 RepID=A0A8J4YIH1_CHIOP|nr:Synaptic vesicle membrane protein VAT-1 -like [Chionoecetes opilio]